MAAITKTPSNIWKAIIRKRGWPSTIKTFRTKRDAEDWARSTEDEMVRGVYINRAGAEKLLLEKALDRYLSEVSASKRESTAYAESHKAKALKKKFGAYSLAAITPDLVAEYRDERLEVGKSASTVRLELSLLSHLFTIAIKEWRVGLFYNPVANIRKPAPDCRRGEGPVQGLRQSLQSHARVDRAYCPLHRHACRRDQVTDAPAGEPRKTHRVPQ